MLGLFSKKHLKMARCDTKTSRPVLDLRTSVFPNPPS